MVKAVVHCAVLVFSNFTDKVCPSKENLMSSPEKMLCVILPQLFQYLTKIVEVYFQESAEILKKPKKILPPPIFTVAASRVHLGFPPTSIPQGMPFVLFQTVHAKVRLSNSKLDFTLQEKYPKLLCLSPKNNTV